MHGAPPEVSAGRGSLAPPSGDGGEAPVVRAAGGGVVASARRWRRGGVLVHRPRYDDWSLPKGKVDPGETDEQAALREVQEEASVEARIGPELPTTTYLDRSGKQKRVRYWAMTVAGGDPLAGQRGGRGQVGAAPEARTRLTYPRDVVVLDALVDVRGGVGAAPGALEPAISPGLRCLAAGGGPRSRS